MGENTRNFVEKGFTLIELLLVVTILGILILSVMGFLNPYEQFTKAKDSQRQQELNQIRVALDAYYNDTGCYPASLSFGSPLTNPTKATTVYMKTVPQDPNCSTDASKCYQYLTDSSASCPQWNVLFGALRAKSFNTQNQTLCPLETVDSNTKGGCLPAYYKSNGYNFCLMSGQIDCGVATTSTVIPSLTPAPNCTKMYSCESPSVSLPKGTCNNVGTDNFGNGLGTYCGAPGCVGNACCLNNCSN